MPLFDFKCINCFCEFEELVKHSNFDAEGKILFITCPSCGNKTPENFIKMINRKTTFSLRGAGWYADGYSSKKENK